jgi:hypothetical protein
MAKKWISTTTGEESDINITINFSILTVTILTAVLLTAAGAGYLVWDKSTATAAGPQAAQVITASSQSLRRFYRSATAYYPNEAPQACGQGYHFASMWELLDPSNLDYAGEHPDAWSGPLYDLGEGPVTGGDGYPLMAYVRTGYNADTSGNPGQANCNNWTSDAAEHYGTIVGLTMEWGVKEDLFVWDVAVNSCNIRTGVWCIED